MEIYKIKITPQAQRQMSAVLSLDIMPKRVALVEEEPWRSHGIIPVKSIRSSEIIS